MRALVTGASSGIGRAIAGELAERGYDLVIAARHDDLLDAADALRRPGVEVTPVRADLATTAGVGQLVAALAGRPLAVAALNAGTAAGGAFMGDTRVGAGPKDDHADVARMGVEALLAGKERATASSLRTQLEAVVSRLVPDAVKAELHRRMSEPGSAPR